MKEEQRLAMIGAANKTLDYLKVKPFAELEDIIKHVVTSSNFSRKKEQLKVLEVASANHVMKVKRGNLNASNREIMEEFMKDLDKIFEKSGF